MAIYHLTAKVISRGRGQSMVAAAAYRFGATLRDERYGITHRYLGKRGVAHAEIIAPRGSPGWVHDRELLWNRVEAGERRKDSQLARLIEIGLPVELTHEQQVMLMRDYIATEFVSQGMVADFCVRGESGNPHSHILLTLRQATVAGFGPKERGWNGKSTLIQWRAAWADKANEHLARAGSPVRIDHRTLEAQQIELTPGRKIGVARARRSGHNLPDHLSRRVEEHQRVRRANGEVILQDPTAVLRALTHQRPVFTLQELAEFLRFRTDGVEQFEAAYGAVRQSNELVALSPGDGDEPRFTSRDIVEAQKSLQRRTTAMSTRRGHAVTESLRDAAVSQFSLNEEQRAIVEYALGDGDAKALLVAGSHGGHPLIGALRHAYVAAGFKLFDLEARDADRGLSLETLGRDAVLFVSGSEMLDLKELERILAAADRARSKVILVGNADRLDAMKVEPPLQAVLRAVGRTRATPGPLGTPLS